MSAIGESWAFVSLGVSCQTAHQIHENIDLLRQLTGDTSLQKSAYIFDWLICPAQSATHMLRDRRFFPDNSGQLKRNPAFPYWNLYDVFFWHDFAAKDIDDPSFNIVKSKYDHMISKREAIAAAANVVWIVSNTQNNLAYVQRDTKINLTLSMESVITELKDAAQLYFQTKGTMLVVTHETLKKSNDRDIHISRFSSRSPTDPMDWKGDKTQWAVAFSSFFENIVSAEYDS